MSNVQCGFSQSVLKKIHKNGTKRKKQTFTRLAAAQGIYCISAAAARKNARRFHHSLSQLF